jgi:hypothetical protein
MKTELRLLKALLPHIDPADFWEIDMMGGRVNLMGWLTPEKAERYTKVMRTEGIEENNGKTLRLTRGSIMIVLTKHPLK